LSYFDDTQLVFTYQAKVLLLKEFAEQRISDDEFQSARRRIYQQTGYTIQDKEALFCYREFRQHFSTASLGVVQAWQGTNII
jgi:hypothetical protein